MRLTGDQIKAKIQGVEYHHHNLITICFIQMENGFVAIGQSVCDTQDQYDKEKGEKKAYRDCFSKILLLEAYLSKQKQFELTGENQ